MAIQQGIDELFDLQTIEGQKQAVLAILRSVSDEVGKLNSMKVGFGNGADKTRDIVSGVNNLGASVTNLTGNLQLAEKAQRNFSKAAIDQIKIAKEQSIIQKNNAAAMALEAKAQKELAAAEKLRNANKGGSGDVPFTHNLDKLEEERLALTKTGTVINEIDQAEADAAISAIEWANAQKKVTGETKVLAKTEKDLEAERLKAAIENENNINQQRVLVKELAAEISSMGSTQLKSNYGQQLVKDFEIAKAELKALEVEGGLAAKTSESAASVTIKNTGNIFQKAFGYARQLAYILPGIGIAGIIGFATEPIIKYVSSLFEATDAEKKADEAAKKHKEEIQALVEGYRTLTDIQDDATGGTIAEISKVQGLARVIQDQTVSYKERNQALTDLKEINKNYFGDLTLEESSLKTLTKAVADYSDALIQQAVIKEVEQDIGKIGAAFFRQSRLVREAEKNLREYKDSVFKANEEDIKRGVIIYDASNKSADLQKELEKQQATLAPLAKQYGELTDQLQSLNFETLKHKTLKTDKTADKNEVDSVKASLELLKYRKEQEAEYQKSITEIDFLSGEQRVAARKKQADLEKDILEIQSQIELRSTKLTSDDVLKIHEKLNADIFKTESERNAGIIAIRKNAAEIEKQIERDATAAFEREEAQRSQARRDAAKDELDAAQARNSGRETNLNFGKDVDLLALEEKRKEGLVSEEDYQKQRQKIESDYDILILKARLDMLKEILAITRDKGGDVTEAEEKIAALRLKIEQETNDKTKKTREEQKADTIKTIQDIQDAYNSVASVLRDAFNIDITKQKNDIQDQMDALDKKTKAEIDGINASGDAEERKAARIQIVQARAAAQKEQLEKRQRQLDQQKAQFDKANAIFEIILNTAAAIAKDLGNPLKVAIDSALGAAQLAIAIATPIPRYKHGTEDHAGGFAVVGDGGKKELVELPSGDMYVTSNKPELVYLPEHSKVLPDAEAVMNDLQGMSYKRLRSAPNVQIKTDFKPLEKKLDKVIGAIERNPTIKNIISHRGVQRLYEDGQRQITWINNSTQSK